jgi:hypothetical protein
VRVSELVFADDGQYQKNSSRLSLRSPEIGRRPAHEVWRVKLTRGSEDELTEKVDALAFANTGVKNDDEVRLLEAVGAKVADDATWTCTVVFVLFLTSA